MGEMVAVEIPGALSARGPALSWAVCLGLILAVTLGTSLKNPHLFDGETEAGKGEVLYSPSQLV